MPSVCVFQLDRENATYFSGETIAGTIFLKTTSDKNVNDVSIILLGEGKVKWEEYHSSSSTTNTTTHFISKETYINNSTRVRGEGILPAGTYTFTFHVALPWECPTSFTGKYGHIRYEISLKIDRYLRFNNIYKKPVTIIKTVDLNFNPAYKLPLVLDSFSTSACCWPCSRGNIFYTLKIPYGAYVPGQIVRYTLHIANQSMDDTEGYCMEFRQKIIFTATSPHRKERHSKKVLVSKYFPDRCLRLTNRNLDGEFLIPATPPSNERSSIIYVEYTLKVIVQLPCCTDNTELRVPIIVGTIPIRENLQTIPFSNTAVQQQLFTTAPEMSPEENESFDSNLPPNYNEIKPLPTFEEATHSRSPFVETDIDERDRVVGLRPLYPMYNVKYPGI